MSHHVRPNPAHRSHTFVSPSLICQEVVRLSQGYNAWQTSHYVRPNPISVRAHHMTTRPLLTCFLRHTVYREGA